MKKIKLKIRTWQVSEKAFETHEIEAWQVDNEFAVHKNIFCDKIWEITYIPFGVKVGFSAETRKQAVDMITEKNCSDLVKKIIEKCPDKYPIINEI